MNGNNDKFTSGGRIRKLESLLVSKRFQISLIFLIPALILMPLLLGNCLHPELRFTACLMNAHDQNIYFGFMKQARDGYWRFLNLPSNIIHPREYIHTLYLLQGLLSRYTGISLNYVNLLSSYMFAVVFGLVMMQPARMVFKRSTYSTLLLVLLLFGSGFGMFGKIYSVVFKHEITVRNMSSFPGDLWMPEMTIWNSICYTPLFIWSYLLIVLVYGGIWFGERKRAFHPFIVSAVAVFLIALSHSYDLVPLGVISLALLIMFRIEHREYIIKPRVFAGYCLYALFFLSSMGYQYHVLKTNPGFSVWAAKNVNLSPDFIVILCGFGFLSLGYVELLIRIRRYLKQRRDGEGEKKTGGFDENSFLTRFMGVWLVVQTLMLYSPFPFARRFILGIIIPLTFYFILFLKRICADCGAFKLLLVSSLCCSCFLTPIYQIAANFAKVMKGDDRYFYTREQFDAYSSLSKGLSDKDVVFASFENCNRLLRFSPAAMLAGSTQQCPESIQRDLRAFFKGEKTDLAPFLKNNRVSYIFLDKKKDIAFIKKHRKFLSGKHIFFENGRFVVYSID